MHVNDDVPHTPCEKLERQSADELRRRLTSTPDFHTSEAAATARADRRLWRRRLRRISLGKALLSGLPIDDEKLYRVENQISFRSLSFFRLIVRYYFSFWALSALWKLDSDDFFRMIFRESVRRVVFRFCMIFFLLSISIRK